MRALFTGVLVLILFALLMGNASAADSCNKGSFDDKVDADTFWWAVVMD